MKDDDCSVILKEKDVTITFDKDALKVWMMPRIFPSTSRCRLWSMRR